MNPVVLPDAVLSKMSPSDRKALGRAGVTADEAQAKIEAKSERELQKQINNWLSFHEKEGELTYNWNRSDKKTTCKKGWSDYTILLPNSRLLLMEVKFGNGELSPEQAKLKAFCLILQQRYAVVRSFQEAITAIKEAGL